MLGLPPLRAVRIHANRTVMVSLSPGPTLRIHRGYANAPDRVLSAIVRFITPGVRRPARLAARRELLAFPIEDHAPPAGPSRRGREQPRPGDAALLERLARLHQRLNQSRFDGRLRAVTFRLSSRMRRRLGELSVDRRSGQVLEITLSRRHLRRDPWEEVEQTVLHEMVHQWQAESGLAVDHGRDFRRMAQRLGIEPRAKQQRR